MAIKWTKRYVNSEYRRFLVDTSTGETIDADYAVKLSDDFICKAVNATDTWNVTLTNSGTVAYSAASGGTALFTTDTGNDDELELTSGLCFMSNKAPIFEAKFAATDVLKGAFALGFSDATSETDDVIAIDFSNAGALVTTASDAALFVFDPDKTAGGTHVWLCAVKGDTDATPVDTGFVPVTGVAAIYRLELDDLGNVKGYINGNYVGTIATCITITDPLCTYVGTINRETEANTWTLDYIRAWQDRA